MDAVVRGLKVFGYVLVSALIVALASPEFRELFEEYPWLVAAVPLINIFLAAVLKFIEGFLPEDSSVRKVI